jgi:hypothetical protein
MPLLQTAHAVRRNKDAMKNESLAYDNHKNSIIMFAT